MKKKLPIILGGGLILVIIILGTLFYLYQYTEVFGKKIIPVKISSLQIQYVPGMDLKTIQITNEKENIVEIQKLKLKSNEIKSLKKNLSKVRSDKIKSKNVLVYHYQIIINENITLMIGDGYGTLKKGKTSYDVIIPSQLSDEINSIIDNNNKKILKTINSESVTVKLEGASIPIKNKTNLKYIQDALSYYPISLKENFKEYQDGYKVEMVLDNYTIYLYENGFGYITQKNEENFSPTYAIFTDNIYELIQNIYSISTK